MDQSPVVKLTTMIATPMDPLESSHGGWRRIEFEFKVSFALLVASNPLGLQTLCTSFRISIIGNELALMQFDRMNHHVSRGWRVFGVRTLCGCFLPVLLGQVITKGLIWTENRKWRGSRKDACLGREAGGAEPGVEPSEDCLERHVLKEGINFLRRCVRDRPLWHLVGKG